MLIIVGYIVEIIILIIVYKYIIREDFIEYPNRYKYLVRRTIKCLGNIFSIKLSGSKDAIENEEFEKAISIFREILMEQTIKISGHIILFLIAPIFVSEIVTQNIMGFIFLFCFFIYMYLKLIRTELQLNYKEI